MQHKGADTGEAVGRALEGIRSLGHGGKIMIKTGSEPALISLREELLSRLPEGAIPVEPPTHESQSNGAIESGVKLFKGLLRVLLLAVEKRPRFTSRPHTR